MERVAEIIISLPKEKQHVCRFSETEHPGFKVYHKEYGVCVTVPREDGEGEYFWPWHMVRKCIFDRPTEE